jgi:tetratricopeptide (TPR) repeat protein
MRRGAYAEAARQYEAWLEQHADASGVLFALGVCRVELGQPRAAVPVLRRHAALEPDSASAHAALGVALLDAASADEARQALDRALTLDPRHPQAIEARARLHLVDGRAGDAVRLLRSAGAMADDPRRRHEWLALLAESLVAAGEPAEAATLLGRVIAAEAASPATTYALACLARLKAGDLDGAALTCEAGMRHHPDSDIESVYLSLPPATLAARTAARLAALGERPDPSELIALGRVLTDVDPSRQTRAEALARQLLTDAVAVAHASASAHYNLGRAVRRTDTRAALEWWEKALMLEPDAPLRLQIETQVGRARDAQGDVRGADAAFRDALETNRGLRRRIPESALEYVRFMKLHGRPEEAQALVDEVVAWNPWAPDARLERARLLADRGDWAAVIVEGQFVLDHAAARKALLGPAHLLLSRAYHRLGQPEKARAHREWLESQ